MDNAARSRGAEPAVPPGTAPDDMRRLKALLFTPESARLEALEARLGSPQRLESATAEVIADALRRAEVKDHDNLSRAIAPVVVAVIRNEIRNSRDMMVEALYPITGRLVSAGIAVAFAEMLATLNARLDTLLSVNQLKWRFLAWRTGRPLAELVLADARRARLERLLYLERGSGHLIAQWQADHGQDARADLLGGMIAALTNFARTALGHEGGDLRRLDLGDNLLYLRTSASHIIAAEFIGELKPGQERALDRGFLDLLEADGTADNDADTGLARLAAALAEAPAAQQKPKRKIRPLSVMAVLALAALVWWGAVQWRNEAKFDHVAAALATFRGAHPEITGWPLSLTWQPRQVTLTGLLPAGLDTKALQNQLAAAAAPWKLVTRIGTGVAAGQAGALAKSELTTSARLDALSNKLAAAQATDDQANAGLNQRLATLRAKDAALTTSLATAQSALQAQVGTLSAAITTPQARLAAALRGFAIFFDKGTDVIDPDVVAARLKAIVPLAKAAGGIRVIGYTDDTGSVALNKKLSLQRAEVVEKMLEADGMPESAIFIVGRAASNPIADVSGGAHNPNRRVQLRGIFEGEAGK
ncbi:MAG: OmpA family protein [Hyphomicrobiales bacterium]|nr:OmpA family protein [Hyphomicrobiales bacterium]